MDTYITRQLTDQHQAKFLREAEQYRLVRAARAGGVSFSGPIKQDRRIRVVLAMGSAAAGILATAALVVGIL